MQLTIRALFTALLLGVATGSAFANPHQDAARLVDGWYHRYLGRHGEPTGIRTHVSALLHGTPAHVVEAGFLASPEYYARHGNNDRDFVHALIHDIAGDGQDRYIGHFLARLQVLQCRDELVLEMMRTFRNGSVVPAQVVVPAPVTVPAPVVVAPGTVPAPAVVETYRPVYPRPAYVPVHRVPVQAVPVPVYPGRIGFTGSYARPGFSIGVGYSR